MTIAAALEVPLNVALALCQTQTQVVTLLECTSRGQQLQQLADLRAVHASCGDLAPLQAFCTQALEQRNSALVPAVALVTQALAAHRRAAAALAARQAEAVEALAALGRQLAMQASESGEEARHLGQQAHGLELAVERQLLSAVQAELAQRAQHLAAAGGQLDRLPHLPPFSAALGQLKSEAAAALQQLEQRRQAAGAQQGRQQVAHQPQRSPADALPSADMAHSPGPPAVQPPAAQQEQQPRQATLHTADAQLLCSGMQHLAGELRQVQAMLLEQQRQRAPMLAFLQQLLPALLPAGPPPPPPPQQQQPAPLQLQWQQLRSPQSAVPLQQASLQQQNEGSPRPPDQRQQHHQQQAGAPGLGEQQLVGGTLQASRELSLGPAVPTAELQPEQQVPEHQQEPQQQHAAATSADNVASAPADNGMPQLAAGTPEAAAAAAAAAAGLASSRALHTALRGDAAPSSSSEERLAAAAGLAEGRMHSPQKTTASALPRATPPAGDAAAAAAVAGGGTPAGFAFPQLQGPAPTPVLPADPPPRQAYAGGAAAGAAPVAADASPVGKENLTSSQSNSQEQGAPPQLLFGGGAAAAAGAAACGKAGHKGAPAQLEALPDSEEQSLPGTQLLESPRMQQREQLPPPAPRSAAPPLAANLHTSQPAQAPEAQEAPLAAAQVPGAAAGGAPSGGPQCTPAPSLAALLDSQRDSTSPKGPGSGRPGSAGGGTAPRPDAAAAAAPGAGAAGTGALPAPAADPDSAGKQRGSSGSGVAPAPAAAATPAPGVAAAAAAQQQQQEQQQQGEGQQPMPGVERKRPASQEGDARCRHKRSRFGRESQEQQEQEGERRRQHQHQGEPQPQLQGQQQQQGHQQVQQQQRQQTQEAGGAGCGLPAGAAGAGEGPGLQPPLTQGGESEQQGAQQPLDGSEPCSSSGIMCTQQPLSSGAAGKALPPLMALPGGPHGGLAPAAAPPLAALHQLWQQQGAASPLLALLGTPGGLSALPAPGLQLEGAAAGSAGGAGISWPPGPSWQPAPVAGAAEGATPRFIGPTGGGSGSTTPWQPAAAVLAPVAAPPPLGCSPLQALLGVPGLGGVADSPAQPSPTAGMQQAHWQKEEVQQAQHHRLARSSSPQGPAMAAAPMGELAASERQLSASKQS